MRASPAARGLTCGCVSWLLLCQGDGGDGAQLVAVVDAVPGPRVPRHLCPAGLGGGGKGRAQHALTKTAPPDGGVAALRHVWAGREGRAGAACTGWARRATPRAPLYLSQQVYHRGHHGGAPRAQQ